jgi:hypothetical protein
MKIFSHRIMKTVPSLFHGIFSEQILIATLPRTNGGGGGTHSPGSEGGRGVNILEDARHWIGLLQYNPSMNKRFVHSFIFNAIYVVISSNAKYLKYVAAYNFEV